MFSPPGAPWLTTPRQCDIIRLAVLSITPIPDHERAAPDEAPRPIAPRPRPLRIHGDAPAAPPDVGFQPNLAGIAPLILQTDYSLDSLRRSCTRPSNIDIPMRVIAARIEERCAPGVDVAALYVLAHDLTEPRAALIADKPRYERQQKEKQSHAGRCRARAARAKNYLRDERIRQAETAKIASAQEGVSLAQCYNIRNRADDVHERAMWDHVKLVSNEQAPPAARRLSRPYLTPEAYRVKRRGWDSFTGEPRPWLFETRTKALRKQLIDEEHWPELYARGFEPILQHGEGSRTVTAEEYARRQRDGEPLFQGRPYPKALREFERRRADKREKSRAAPRKRKTLSAAELWDIQKRARAAPVDAPPAPRRIAARLSRCRVQCDSRVGGNDARAAPAQIASPPAAPLDPATPRAARAAPGAAQCAAPGCAAPPHKPLTLCLRHAVEEKERAAPGSTNIEGNARRARLEATP